VQRAVENFNSGNAPIMVREFLDKRGAPSSCRIASQPGRSDLLLTIITKTHGWAQATIDPGQTLPSADVTFGGDFPPKTEAEYRKRGTACKVSAADGSLALK
jgi:hypothetical protein